MSAREKILTYDEDNRENLSDLLDDYAHELAERQRAWIDGRSDMPWWVDQIPDVIDPKVQCAATEGDGK